MSRRTTAATSGGISGAQPDRLKEDAPALAVELLNQRAAGKWDLATEEKIERATKTVEVGAMSAPCGFSSCSGAM